MSAARVSAAVAVAAVLIACATGRAPRHRAKTPGRCSRTASATSSSASSTRRSRRTSARSTWTRSPRSSSTSRWPTAASTRSTASSSTCCARRELYRNYLKLDPDSANRPGVEKLVTELGARIDQARAGAVEPPPVAAARAAPHRAAPPRVAPPPPAAPRHAVSPALVTGPAVAARPEERSSSAKTWLIAGGITAVVVGAAVTILLVTRSDTPSTAPAST